MSGAPDAIGLPEWDYQYQGTNHTAYPPAADNINNNINNNDKTVTVGFAKQTKAASQAQGPGPWQ